MRGIGAKTATPNTDRGGREEIYHLFLYHAAIRDSVRHFTKDTEISRKIDLLRYSFLTLRYEGEEAA